MIVIKRYPQIQDIACFSTIVILKSVTGNMVSHAKDILSWQIPIAE